MPIVVEQQQRQIILFYRTKIKGVLRTCKFYRSHFAMFASSPFLHLGISQKRRPSENIRMVSFWAQLSFEFTPLSKFNSCLVLPKMQLLQNNCCQEDGSFFTLFFDVFPLLVCGCASLQQSVCGNREMKVITSNILVIKDL